ncbi:NUDIX hydrolase [Sediminihabitans luteus]|uniref:NUDIX hydrolase n=1 Tax=Sediminihabitans luteus TaxID=1138585 RepID=UPI001EF39098|nr:NUDIX domain-containing protein [Sediminihabitans luteus]
MDNPTPTDAPGLALAGTLAAWTPADTGQAALRDEYVAFVAAHGEDAWRRDAGPEHLTGSCFVLTPDLTRVLLCFHRKGLFWVQLGGHVEPSDASVAAGAFREAREEGGVVVDPWSWTPADLDRHALASAFGRCRVHWDVGFVAFAAADAVPVVSDESEDVAWWPVDDLPESVPPGFRERLAGVLREVRSRGVSGTPTGSL